MNGHETNTKMKPTGNVITGLRNILLLGNLLVLAACGGGAGTEQLPPESDPNLTRRAVDFYNGVPEESDIIRAYKTTVFDGLRLTGPAAGLRDRCGGCHTSTADNPQEPYFVQRDNVNIAYRAAFGLDAQGNQVGTSYINLSSPENSILVTKMRSTPGPTGHNCWEENKESCAVYIINRIQNMLATSQGGGSREIPLTAPQDHEIEVFRSFPDTTPTGFSTLHNILQANCSDCHVPGGSPQGSPFFAVADQDTAYDELRVSGKIVLGDTVEARAQSRIVVRPRDEDHGCWDTDVPPDGQVNCPESAQAILDAIAVLVNSIPVQDPQDISNSNLDQVVTSKALTMADALVASGGNRYENEQIALYEFRTGVGRRILDLGATAPGVDLTLFGTEGVDYRWLGNFGIEFIGDNGRASANPNTVHKFYDEIRSTGAYSIEAWVVPNNTTQEDAAIVSYSAASDDRNFGLEQNMYNYTLYNRLTLSGVPTNPQGEPLSTPDMAESAQAALQHVVVTYNTIGGRQIFVNGRRVNGADETLPDGSLAEWRDDYQFILGNSERGDRPWRGALRMVAIHNSALTPQQIEQNFDVGVGEKFFLLFPLRQKDPDRTDNITDEPPLNGIPDSCHIKFDFMQFDGYSYLFSKPTFVCLNPNITAADVAGIQIRGMWLGINGNFPNAGQAFQNLNVTINATDYVPGRGQLLSNIGTTIELQNGPLGTDGLPPDQFFLGFEAIGAESTPPAYIPDPAANLDPPAAPPEPPASSDIGLRTFDEINATFAQLTGLPEIGESDINGITVFGTYKQQLPTVENIDGFLPSHQMAIAQLALTYCDQLVRNDISGDGSSNGLFSAFNYNNALNATTRQTVVNRFMADFMNYDTGATPPELATQPAAADVMSYLTSSTAVPFTDDVGDGDHGTFTSLMQLMDPTSDPSRTRDVVTATCGTILGSAITIIQ